MKITILTLFPEIFTGAFEHSILKRAQDKKIIEINFINIREFGIGRHRVVDDKPYGGGPGMVLRVDVVKKAIDKAKASIKKNSLDKKRTILLDPQGKKFSQEKAQELAKLEHLILICGHYEGIDERIKDFVDEEISIGDYVLTGGEIPAMVITDAVVRLIPSALGKDESSKFESFQTIKTNGKEFKALEYPQYTRPFEFEKKKVPDILISGDHKEIEKWRTNQALIKTRKRRPDLL